MLAWIFLNLCGQIFLINIFLFKYIIPLIISETYELFIYAYVSNIFKYFNHKKVFSVTIFDYCYPNPQEHLSTDFASDHLSCAFFSSLLFSSLCSFLLYFGKESQDFLSFFFTLLNELP